MLRRRIQIKSPEQLATMRRAGRVVAAALRAAAKAAMPGATTAEVDAAAADVIAAAGARPSFLGYHGFPAHTCVSVNDEVLHGIPGPRALKDGDLVSVDCGAIVDGWHGDAAVTVRVGRPVPDDLLAPGDRDGSPVPGDLPDDPTDRLSEVTRRALWAGIAAARPGGRLTDIGAAVEAVLTPAGLGIVAGYVGHGIGSAMHMTPDVANVGPAGRGPRLLPGMAVAIEPMSSSGSGDVNVLGDDWTVVLADGSPGAHWEHTVAITEDGPRVLTLP